MSNNPAKYEVLIKQYLRSILDISDYKRFSNNDNINNIIRQLASVVLKVTFLDHRFSA